jgi:hypothetical protein
MREPATDWREHIPEGEAERLEQLGEALAQMQRGFFARYGRGRALHRKPVAALRARLDVAEHRPAWVRHGVFRDTGSLEVVVRLSSGSARRQPDKIGDIRGFTWKVLGLSGPAALGGTAHAQDFLCINQETFGIKDAGDFVGVALAASKGPLPLLAYMAKTYGLGMFARMKQLLGAVNRPFSGFGTETFSTVLPIACGPYAMRLRIAPLASKPSLTPASWSKDVAQRLATGELAFEVQAQAFVDERSTPIEDASQPWDEAQSPWIAVGRLTIPAQSLESPEARQLQQEVEAMRFDPWGGLAEHRPLGHIMRARKAAYYASQKARAEDDTR